MANDMQRQRRPLGMCGLRDWLPDDYWKHRQTARREKLLSWRSLLDAALQRLETEPAVRPAGERPRVIPQEFWAHRRAARRENVEACRSLVNALFDGLEDRPGQATTTPVEIA